MNKVDLEQLTDIRLAEAQILFDAQKFHGAYYLAGYSLECALKVCIAKQVREYDFPNKHLATKSHTHNLSDLLSVTGLKQKLMEKEAESDEFTVNWGVAKDWSESYRYECDISEIKAKELLDAIIDEESGILKWLKQYW